MFYCQFCGTLVSRGIRSRLITVETKTQKARDFWRAVPESDQAKDRYIWRRALKPQKPRPNPKRTKEMMLRKIKRKRQKMIEILIAGPLMRQIAKERRACPACAKHASALAGAKGQ